MPAGSKLMSLLIQHNEILLHKQDIRVLNHRDMPHDVHNQERNRLEI